MVQLTREQRLVLETDGFQLVKGGPGSGKTTVSILKAAQIARSSLGPGQKVLFLSFARATVSRVMEAIAEEDDVSKDDRDRIEVETYHAFFWRILKSHGYLVGLPRTLNILTPQNEAIELSSIRRGYGRAADLTEAQRAEKAARESAERTRLAVVEGRVAFGLFAGYVAEILERSDRIRRLVATMYPAIILDEFQDTSGEQWRVVQALGDKSTLIALADPEQRIFDFIGADPARLDHFIGAFAPTVHDLQGANHRSAGTEIALFGNHVLTGQYKPVAYLGIRIAGFPANENQAYAQLIAQTVQARTRLINSAVPDWSLAVLVPTKKMTRLVSDLFRERRGPLPAIPHTAAVDMHGAILAAEIIALLMQSQGSPGEFPALVLQLRDYYRGRGGDTPTRGDLTEGERLETALGTWNARAAAGRPPPGNSVLIACKETLDAIAELRLTGDPDRDWQLVRSALEAGACARLRLVAEDARNIRLLDRGTQLRAGLSADWRINGYYRNALEITRQAFVQEHFSKGQKPESGVVVMNMHKAKGKQFDEVVIFEGWPRVARQQVVANPDRIVRGNRPDGDLGQARQSFRVSVTRAKSRTTILTPVADACILLPPQPWP